METYRLVWDDFCSTMLEAIKPPYGEAASAQTYREAIAIFEDNLRILHPFTPFLTEELWQDIAERSPDEALIVSSWPKHEEFDADFIANFDFAMEVVSGIRTIRKNNQIAFKETVDLVIADNEQQGRVMEPIIQKLGNVANISHGEAVDGALTFRVKANEYFVPISGAVDVEAQIAKISEELSYTEGFLKSVQKKLSNERFVNNAPEQVVAVERKKEADALAKIETLKASLAALQ
jgi:valyl-tRNA synthetase